MSSDTTTPSFTVDTSNCDREPIHIPGFIQPHGLLFVLSEPGFTILQASDNTLDYFGKSASELLGQPLAKCLDEDACQRLLQATQNFSFNSNPIYVFSATLGKQRFHALAHRYDSLLILELERAVDEHQVAFQNLYAIVSGAVARLEAAADSGELCRLAAREIRQLTGLDKVMIYLFDEEQQGIVVAEERAEGMDEYLGLHFPASDIPKQARALYLKNKLRLISDVYSTPVPVIPTLNPQTERSLDLSYSTLRSVSPIHIEYLKNMGVGASMSVSIVRGDALAGLVACHHRTPKYLSYEVRTACEFLGQVLSQQITSRELATEREERLQKANLNGKLLSSMTRAANFTDGLAQQEYELLDLVGATGVAICTEDDCVVLGQTPPQDQIKAITEWLGSQQRDMFVTDSLPGDMPEAEKFQSGLYGLLAVSTSGVHRNYILWFRPEVIHTINWAGNPHKPVEMGTGRLHPRQSFELWKETVHSRSLPWRPAEIAAANELRAAIVGIVLRQAEERAQLASELQRTNQELEAFSYSVSHDLRAPFRHIIGFANMLHKRAGDSLDSTSQRYLNTITDSAHYAGTLVDNLLAFSHMGRAEMRLGRVNMALLFEETRKGLEAEYAGRNVEWHIGALPMVYGDLAMLRLVVQNLLSNAVKYTRNCETALIEVECRDDNREWIFNVRDNGVGFDMKYVGKLFGVFQRLHRSEEFEGTGIGLANLRRIVLRHGGRTWAEGAVDEGATFSFSLPKTPLEKQAGETP